MNGILKGVRRRVSAVLTTGKWMIVPLIRIAGLMVAGMWRRLLFRTTFIAITGSVGKTTSKDAIAHVLGAQAPVIKTRRSNNHFRGLIIALLSVRPWHRYAVIEIGLSGPGQMKQMARAVRPDIAIWTSVARTHQQSFRSLEVTAREKSYLIESLTAGGLAILNQDSPHIAAYQPPRHVRVIRYGAAEGCDWRALDVSSKWPRRLSFRLETTGDEESVETQLVGKHWISSLLPALVLAPELGMGLRRAVEELASFQPVEQRLAPAITPQGATFLRDERNGSIDTLRAAFEVLREAEARRKVIILSDVTDSSTKIRQRQRGAGAGSCGNRGSGCVCRRQSSACDERCARRWHAARPGAWVLRPEAGGAVPGIRVERGRSGPVARTAHGPFVQALFGTVG